MKDEPSMDFDGFYAATYRRMVGQLYAMTGSMTEAEDCVQEAYARAWQRWARVSRHGAPEAWVRTVAYRLSVSSWRKTVNRLSAHRRERGQAVVQGLNPDHLALVAALRRISADQRESIVLYHLVGLSVEEIAAQSGVPAGTVKARLSRGRKALAPHLNEYPETAAARRTDQGAASRPSTGKEI
ncbi:SigE family RNA polymerase sigma factor [Streptacidiphilus sp. EB103A]|uniref:SigE family RNA polymerase sigma factor n=1 Tax=Streptacidiphilus sp. EB103A TaxID=3156275 RepID=UPI0035110E59